MAKISCSVSARLIFFRSIISLLDSTADQKASSVGAVNVADNER